MDELIKALDILNAKVKEALTLGEELKGYVLKLNGQDELWGSDRDNKNEDSNLETEQ